MAAIRVAEVALTLVIRIAYEVLEQRLAASPRVVGDALASQVQAYARREGLGYYPALEFFQHQGGIDPELLSAAQNIAWYACEWVCEQIRVRLRAPFSSVSIDTVQSLAFTMPSVRSQQPNAFEALAAHYAPNRVRVHIRVSNIVKGEPQGMDKFARQMALRWLKDRFESVQVIDSRML
jgi:hypothetical protein